MRVVVCSDWGCLWFGLSILLGWVVTYVSGGSGLYTGPYFSDPKARNVTVHQNTIAYLPCIVKQLGDKSVSWVRARDADILTVGRYTFVRDERLSVHYTSDTHTWTLVIKFVQERDAGTYECQVSTEPKLSLLVHLSVIVPQVEVIGAVDKYVRQGSTAVLQCSVSTTVQLPDFIFWYHRDQRVLEYHKPRLTITTTRGGDDGGDGGDNGGDRDSLTVTSTLTITDARAEDAGNYTCLPSNLHPATTLLHVLTDEHPAAMHTGAAQITTPTTQSSLTRILFVMFILWIGV